MAKALQDANETMELHQEVSPAAPYYCNVVCVLLHYTVSRLAVRALPWYCSVCGVVWLLQIKELKEELKEEDAQEKAEFERECAALSAYIEERLERLGERGWCGWYTCGAVQRSHADRVCRGMSMAAFLEDTTVDHDVLVGNLTKDDETRIKQEVSTLKRKVCLCVCP